MELRPRVSKALLARRQRAKVLHRLGHNIIEQLKVDAPRLRRDAALVGDIARLVDLDLRALPGDVKVRFDGHVGCRRSEESLVERRARGEGGAGAEGSKGSSWWGKHRG